MRSPIIHSTGMEDLEGGDLWVNKSTFIQVRCGEGSCIPKSIYDHVKDCPVALVRRVGPKDIGYPWLKIERIDPP